MNDDGVQNRNLGMERQRGVGEDGREILEMDDEGGERNSRISITRGIAGREIEKESRKRSVKI